MNTTVEPACSCCSSTKPIQTAAPIIVPRKSTWQKVRAGVMFAVACATSPCCTPLIAPLAIALLAGTPAALWLSANIGWVYGGLTLISVVSFVLAWRWFNTKAKSATATAKPIANVSFDLNYPYPGGIPMSQQESPAIACNLNAIAPADRDQHTLTSRELFATVTEVRELADGYTFKLPAETLRSAAAFIANERLCCPFFDFTLKAGAESGLWLSLTGSDEVKQFVRAEFGSLVSVPLGA